VTEKRWSFINKLCSLGPNSARNFYEILHRTGPSYKSATIEDKCLGPI